MKPPRSIGGYSNSDHEVFKHYQWLATMTTHSSLQNVIPTQRTRCRGETRWDRSKTPPNKRIKWDNNERQNCSWQFNAKYTTTTWLLRPTQGKSGHQLDTWLQKKLHLRFPLRFHKYFKIWCRSSHCSPITADVFPRMPTSERFYGRVFYSKSANL